MKYLVVKEIMYRFFWENTKQNEEEWSSGMGR